MGRGALVAGLALLLALALLASGGAGLGLGGPGVVQAAGTSFSSCPSQSTLQGYLDTGGTITNTGTPCTVDLTSALTLNPGVNVTIVGGEGLVLDQTASGVDVIDITDSTASRSTLSLDRVTVEKGQQGIFDGSSAATVNLTDSVLSGAVVAGVEAGAVTVTASTIGPNSGYGIIAVTATATNSSLSGNSYGIFAVNTATVTDSTVSGNSYGIDAVTATVTDSTFTGNHYGIAANTATVTDSTVSGNAVDGIVANTTATVTDSTISGNGGVGLLANTATVTATILAANTLNCQGAITDGGYNLSTDSSCGFSAAGSANNVPANGTGGLNLANSGAPGNYSGPPNLLSGNYGGPPQTIALGLGSIAIDAIPVNGQGQCLNASGQPIVYPGTSTPVTTDQRGMTRPQGARCDIGAYELVHSPASLTSCPDQALFQTYLYSAPDDGSAYILNLPPNCTINLTYEVVVGAGVNITVNGNGLTLGQATGHADGIVIGDANASLSTLSLDQVTVENADYGVFDLSQAATVNLTGSTVSSKMYGILAGTVTVTGSTVSGASQAGILAGTVTVTDSTVSDNGMSGIQSNTATVTDSTVSGNRWAGVYAPNGAVTVTGSTLSGNGDGVTGGTTTVTNSTVSGSVLDGIGSFGNATVTDSTVSDNGRYGITAANTATVTATILAGNGTNCHGTVTDGGYNLSTDDTCGFSAAGSLNNVAATGNGGLNLLSLGNYGGPIQTIALGPGSIAIDAIPADTQNDCLNAAGSPIDYPGTSTPVTTDERGTDRPQGPKCDIGAYEAPAVSIETTPGSPASSGWYNAATLGGTGKTLSVSAGFTGLAAGELPSCSGATFSGLPTAVTGLNQTGSGSASLGDGTYTISCGVSQAGQPAIVLGVSQNVAQPLTLKVDTTPPAIDITSPTATTYLVGSSASATFGCTDPTPGSGMATANGCVGTLDGSGISSGTTLDTSSAAIGPHTLQVVGTDVAGNQATKTVSYQVEALPAPTLTINGSAPNTSSSYWYNLTNSANGVNLVVSDTSSQVTGYSCTDNSTTLELTLSTSGALTGTASLGDGVQTLSCTASASPTTSIPSAATTVTIQVDLTPPVITSPAAGGSYLVKAAVPLSCSDPAGPDGVAGSGIATCAATVKEPDGSTTTVSQGQDLPTSQAGVYSVTPNTVTDIAGNADTASFSYTVDYVLTVLRGSTTTVTQGYYAVIRLAPEDVNGHDYASRLLKVSSVELDGPNGQTIAFAYPFQYGTFDGTPGYQLTINTRNLSPGPWTLVVQIAGNPTPTVYRVSFTVR